MAKNIFQQAYEAIIFERKKVGNKTTIHDRMIKLREETNEANKALYYCMDDDKLTKEAVQELIDVIIVCAVTIIHFGFDIMKEMRENIKHQLTRKD
jgi:NTP pyrophosphatase (non-canonical NTP hydrolase)